MRFRCFGVWLMATAPLVGCWGARPQSIGSPCSRDGQCLSGLCASAYVPAGGGGDAESRRYAVKRYCSPGSCQRHDECPVDWYCGQGAACSYAFPQWHELKGPPPDYPGRRVARSRRRR